jgi:hypothetical protein
MVDRIRTVAIGVPTGRAIVVFVIVVFVLRIIFIFTAGAAKHNIIPRV